MSTSALQQVSVAMLADGTIMNEVDLCHTLVQWPYLSEMSLVNAVSSIFLPSWCTGPFRLSSKLQLTRWPWFYFNLILRESQVLPAASPSVGACRNEPTHPEACAGMVAVLYKVVWHTLLCHSILSFFLVRT